MRCVTPQQQAIFDQIKQFNAIEEGLHEVDKLVYAAKKKVNEEIKKLNSLAQKHGGLRGEIRLPEDMIRKETP